MKSTRSVGCNHFEEMYVINPKEETYKSYDLMTYRLHCKRITYAYRRLHTNPSDWIKKSKSQKDLDFLAPPAQLEPTTLLLRCPKVAVGLERLQLLTAAPTHIRFICHRQRSYALQITAARSWSLRRFGGYKILLSLKLN